MFQKIKTILCILGALALVAGGIFLFLKFGKVIGSIATGFGLGTVAALFGGNKAGGGNVGSGDNRRIDSIKQRAENGKRYFADEQSRADDAVRNIDAIAQSNRDVLQRSGKLIDRSADLIRELKRRSREKNQKG